MAGAKGAKFQSFAAMDPPSYEESQNQSGQNQDQNQNNYHRNPEQRPQDPPGFNEGKNQHQYQQGYSDYPEDKKHPQGPGYEGSGPGFTQPGYSQPGYGGQGYNNPSSSSGTPPNTYFVPPQMVNITQANPQHLNPSYQQYLERDQQRIKEGNYPDPSRGLDKTRNKGGKSGFPGRSGITYNNAANK